MPITIVLGNAEYCLMLVSLAAAIAVKSRKPAPVVCNVACQARIESLEQAVQSLQEMPRFNQSGCMLEPQERASNPQPLISSTPTLLPWIHAGTARLTPFRPTPATDPHNEKSTDLAKRLEASLSTLKKEAVSYGTHTDSVTLHMPYEKQGHCAFFTKLPLELRKLIYEHLLVSDETITPDRQLVGDKRENYLERNGDDYTPAKGLDATILQSCEAVYDEAYPILYGQNNFHFHDSLELYDFKADGMKPIYDPDVRNSRFQVNSTRGPVGRLSSIRHISYDMSMGTHGLGSLVGKWSLALEEGVSFPAIETFQLDFKGWELSDRGKQRLLHRIITKFKHSGQKDVGGTAVGLRKLTFQGDYDEKLTEELRGLIRPDGRLAFKA